jgi:hypothetical protein
VQSKLNKVVHLNRPVAVQAPSGAPAIVLGESYFSAATSSGSFDEAFSRDAAVFNGERTDRINGLPVMAGARSTSANGDRLATLLVTGINQISYSRTAETVIRVPLNRLNQALQRVNRLGGRVVEVSVN